VDVPSRVNAQLRHLPSVDKLVEAAGLNTKFARWCLLEAARNVLAETRAEALAGSSVELDLDSLCARTRRLAEKLAVPFPRRVLNATGVVLHTNLGRAPLSAQALQEVASSAGGYSDLELDVDTGARGSRQERVGHLLRILSGAEAALVVNNNAAALLLAVDTLSAGKEVVLSRGELVEIGGAFRVPEIMESSRAELREVGTTNRTHLRDYAAAIGEETGLLLKVHRSNFRIEGFTAEVSLAELASLGAERGIPVLEDRGSGTFLDLRSAGVPEREVWSGLREGADLVLFSGDKLLGGPQAGIALGRRDLIDRMKQSPLARALRVDKMTLAALHWTLRALLEGREREIPVLAMLLASGEELQARAERLAKALQQSISYPVTIECGSSPVGGGALPDIELPGVVVCVNPGGSAARIARGLRGADPPVLVRVQRDVILLDPRTLSDEEVALVANAFAGVTD
jgi:L-seryl-tRNA(Ser) seleniumtransferase